MLSFHNISDCCSCFGICLYLLVCHNHITNDCQNSFVSKCLMQARVVTIATILIQRYLVKNVVIFNFVHVAHPPSRSPSAIIWWRFSLWGWQPIFLVSQCSCWLTLPLSFLFEFLFLWLHHLNIPQHNTQILILFVGVLGWGYILAIPPLSLFTWTVYLCKTTQTTSNQSASNTKILSLANRQDWL